MGIRSFNHIKILSILFFSFFGCLPIVNAQTLVINEFLASNETINRDPDYIEFSDWIELFNVSGNTIDIGGYFLTDNLSDSTKWQIPGNTSIDPGGFLIFWADGKDTTLTGFHLNFKLQKSGEEIGLYNPQGVLIDNIVYIPQSSDVSFGRKPDGSSYWYLFNNPTPGSTNSTESFLKSSPPEFSLECGFYSEAQMLTITTNAPDAVIRFTMNGNDPDETSPVYVSPIQIRSRAGEANNFSMIRTNRDPFMWLPDWEPPNDEVFKSTVVRARVFESEKDPSDIVTKTYFVDPDIHQRYATIPVISLVSDYANLFDNSTGIYVPGNTHRYGDSESGNYFQDWEKPAHIEFFETGGELGFSQDVGIRIQGGTSPASPQKGLHVIARSEYGKNRIEYPIFQNNLSKAKNLNEFKRFIIRAWGSLITGLIFNDAFAHRLFAESDLDIQAYRPAILFINGEYWGIHAIRESNKNSWYYQYHYNIDRENPGFDILQHGISNGSSYAFVDEGDRNHWNAMMNFLNTQDMSLPENYEYIKTQMDVDNFITYMGHCIFVGKWDWPNNNEASWRPKTPDGKWKWIQYDMETGFGIAADLGPQYEMLGPQHNMIKHVVEGVPIPEFGLYGPHPVLVRLLQNDEFKQSFIDWLFDHLNNELSPESINAKLDEIAGEIEPYLNEYRERCPYISYSSASLEPIRDYINQRGTYVLNHLVEQFGSNSNINFPDQYHLYQNYPNPFNPTTNIRYSLSAVRHNGNSIVRLIVYDILGNKITTLVEGIQPEGDYTVEFNAAGLSSGVYFYQIRAGNFIQTRKMVLVR
ncbi:CotH kinase family protein [Bacteroidota bacterium]